MPISKRIAIKDHQNQTFLIELTYLGSNLSIDEFKIKISNALYEWKKTKEFLKYSKQILNGVSILELYNLLSTYYMKHKELRDSIKNQGFTKFNIYKIDLIETPKSTPFFFQLTKNSSTDMIQSNEVEISDYQVGDLTEILSGARKNE